MTSKLKLYLPRLLRIRHESEWLVPRPMRRGLMLRGHGVSDRVAGNFVRGFVTIFTFFHVRNLTVSHAPAIG